MYYQVQQSVTLSRVKILRRETFARQMSPRGDFFPVQILRGETFPGRRSYDRTPAELILWVTGHVEQHGTKRWGVGVHLDPHIARKWGVRTPGPPQDRRHCLGCIAGLIWFNPRRLKCLEGDELLYGYMRNLLLLLL